MKTCFKCKIEKPLADYYAHSGMADGHLNKCKDCTKKDSEMRFKEKLNDPNWVIKERERQRKKEAKRRVLGLVKPPIRKQYDKSKYKEYVNAIRDKKIKRAPCVICGESKSQGHHEDYDKPLDVVWLCVRHHQDRHIHLRNAKTLNQNPQSIEDFVDSMKKILLSNQ
jgi:hypothetical protein